MGFFSFRRVRRGSPIVVVSGLPRSGTSMTMQMLHAGGLPILADGIRAADVDNPRGYFELDAVKSLHERQDLGWLRDARGKAVKIISYLLTWLPETYEYRVLFMRRDLDEIVASQQTMIANRSGPSGPVEPRATVDAMRTKELYADHLAAVARFLARRPCFTVLDVDYRDALARPRDAAGRIAGFVDAGLNVDAMVAAVDPALHRNRQK
jgi:hypothetical protein